MKKKYLFLSIIFTLIFAGVVFAVAESQQKSDSKSAGAEKQDIDVKKEIARISGQVKLLRAIVDKTKKAGFASTYPIPEDIIRAAEKETGIVLSLAFIDSTTSSQGSGTAGEKKSEPQKPKVFLPYADGEAVTYAIQSGAGNPKFLSADIDPLKVYVGDTQTLTVKVASSAANPVISAKAVTKLDTQTLVIDLAKWSEESGATVFKTSWKVYDTHDQVYKTTFTAKDFQGNENSITLDWSDPCSGFADGADSTLDSDCAVSVVDGVENGNVTIPLNTTLTLNAGSTFIWNPGKSITVTGAIAVAKGAEIKKGYVMYADSDGDGYAASTTKYFSATSTATGYVRTVSASGTSDPNDSTASCWQNKYADTDGDGYGAGSAVCVGNDAGYVSNNTDCSASDAAKWQNLAGYADSDTDTYTTGDSQSVCSGSSLPSGYLASANGSDCNDGNGYVYQTVASLVTDGDNDGYSTGASGSQCVGSTSVVSGRTYYKNTSNASSWLASASSLGTDCSDSDGALYQNLTGYPDADGDAYYSQSSQSVCSGGSLPAGYSASQGNDCYDANANAKPGQTSLFFTNRGDGSFDYDCNGSLTYAYTYTCEYGNNLYACSSPYNGTYCNYNPVSEACYSCFNSAYLCTSATISCPVGGGCGTYVATTSVFIDENCSAGRFKALEQSCR